MIDYEADADAPALPDDAGTKRLATLAQQQVNLSATVKRLERDLAARNKELHELRTKTLPGLMKELGVTKLGLSDGSELTVERQYFASIPSMSAIEKARGEERENLLRRRSEAFEWLRAQGHEDLIKNEVIASFGKGSDEEATALWRELMGKGVDVSHEENVHASTLKAFVREQSERGTILPDCLGAFKLDVSEVKQ